MKVFLTQVQFDISVNAVLEVTVSDKSLLNNLSGLSDQGTVRRRGFPTTFITMVPASALQNLSEASVSHWTFDQ